MGNSEARLDFDLRVSAMNGDVDALQAYAMKYGKTIYYSGFNAKPGQNSQANLDLVEGILNSQSINRIKDWAPGAIVDKDYNPALPESVLNYPYLFGSTLVEYTVAFNANQGGGTPPAGGAPAGWYDIGSKINATWGAVTPFIKSSIAYSRAGAAYLKYYASGWAGGSRALIKTVKFARVAAVAGFAAGEIMDGIALYNGKIGWTHAGANLIMGVVGFTEAAPAAIIYFGVDAFYPGGVSGLVHKYGDVHTDFSHIGEPQDNWDR